MRRILESVKPRDASMLGALIAAVLAFYALPLFTDRVTIQWDAVQYFYPYQKHFSDSLRAGRLPFWTSVLFGGFPFLADMQSGAWYPLNWPFFLAGIQPRSIFWELALHAAVAAAGAYLLARRLTGSRTAGIVAGLSYSLSGYFAAHSQHVCLFQAAAWLPMLLWLVARWTDRPGRHRAAALALAAGCIALTGHFQTVLYDFCAAAVFAVALVAGSRRQWPRAIFAIAVIAGGALALAAVQIFPSAELVAHSLRSRLSAGDWTLGILQWRSAATYLMPNAAGAFRQPYTGPADISQHYFYAGILLLPLAILGLRERALRWVALALVVPFALYAAGPAGLLYHALVRLPGFSSVRAPTHAMFVVTLGLALLAGAGAARLTLFRRGWILAAALGAFWLADLLRWNMLENLMVYAKGSYEQVHAPGERWFRELVKPPLPQFERLAAPGRWVLFYPAVAPFGYGVETTFGANALLPTRWYEYLLALNENEKLMSATGVRRYFDRNEWVVHRRAPALPRFYFPPQVISVPDEAAELRALRSLDPERAAVVVSPSGETANPPGSVLVLEAAEDAYRLRVQAGGDATMRIAVPWFPGWRAEIDGRTAALFPLDHALMGLRVPAGEHVVGLRYHSTWFAAGAATSIAALVACILLLMPWRRRPVHA